MSAIWTAGDLIAEDIRAVDCWRLRPDAVGCERHNSTYARSTLHNAWYRDLATAILTLAHRSNQEHP